MEHCSWSSPRDSADHVSSGCRSCSGESPKPFTQEEATVQPTEGKGESQQKGGYSGKGKGKSKRDIYIYTYLKDTSFGATAKCHDINISQAPLGVRSKRGAF